MDICVIGAGYVGLTTALGLAYKGNNVICVDRSENKVDKLNKGIATIYEEGLDELLKECLIKRKIMFTTNLELGVENSKVIFIAVGTPPKENGEVDLSQVNNVIHEISSKIKNYKVIVVKSTVPVGTQKHIKNLLQSRGIPEENFDIVSNPEFLREGMAISDFLKPDRIVIGYDSERAKNIMDKLYKTFNSKIIFTNPETSELIKYASNAFLATKVSFINEIANLCNMAGADVLDVAYAMGLDNRISPRFLKAGIGFGGSCFPKDTKALVKIGEQYGCDMKIVKSTIEVNEAQRMLPIKILLSQYDNLKNKIVTVLGLTFKPGTDDIREAPSIYIIDELIKKGAIIKCYDPKASDSISSLFPDIKRYKSLYESLEGSHCAIICTEWNEIAKMDLKKLKQKMEVPFIIDGRNILNINNVRENDILYYSIGRGYNIS